MKTSFVRPAEGELRAVGKLLHRTSTLAFCEASVFDDLGPASEFSAARYADVCEETPLPWDPGTPVDQRPAVAQQRLAALGSDAFAPFDPQAALTDEVSLCLRWPDVPHPAPASPPPYPAVPTLILQGGEDIRTPPEESARVQGF